MVVGGTDLSGLSDRKLTLLRRERMGFVFQFFNLIPTLSAEENVLLPALIAGERAGKYAERLDELLQLVGLTSRRTHRPDELSGGEQQRVAIARALIRNPDIILADEPTGNLDSKTGAGVLELLEESASRYDQTILMVTHDPRAAASADRVVFLSDGRVVDEARDPDPDEILERIKNLESADKRPGLRFREMNDEEAREIAGWRYDPPYNFYDAPSDADDLEELLDPERRAGSYFSAFDDRGVLVGFFQFEAEGENVDVGLGLRPDLTGGGLGLGFLLAGLRVRAAALSSGAFGLSVATFNERAIRVYERAGFRRERSTAHHTNGGEYLFLAMAREA